MSLTLLEAAQAKLEGKRVEWRRTWDDPWTEWAGVYFYHDWGYRIAPTPKKKVKYLCWAGESDLRWIKEGCLMPSEWERVPEEDKEVEVVE